MPDARTDVVEKAAASISKGSQSFAAAARLFARPTRENAIMLYAWCRRCDDVVDGQDHGHGAGVASRGSARGRLRELEEQTRAALNGDVPISDPAFAALAEVVRTTGMPPSLPLAHLDGFRMDVEGRRYRTLGDLLAYCYGVAGVVGVMMGHVMGVRDAPTLDRACDLGLAFQLTNIARDLVDDAGVGRIYAPSDWLAEAGLSGDTLADPGCRTDLARVAARLVKAAEPYYASARTGIEALPFRSSWAIGTALSVYRAIGAEVNRRGPRAWDRRVSTSKGAKLGFLLAAGGRTLLRPRAAPADRIGLWTRPA